MNLPPTEFNTVRNINMMTNNHHITTDDEVPSVTGKARSVANSKPSGSNAFVQPPTSKADIHSPTRIMQ